MYRLALSLARPPHTVRLPRMIPLSRLRGATRTNRRFLPASFRCWQAKKVALVACMRKLLTILNAMMRTMTVWKPGNILRSVSMEV